MICPTISWDKHTTLVLTFIRLPRLLTARSQGKKPAAEVCKEQPPLYCTHRVSPARSAVLDGINPYKNKKGVSPCGFTPFCGYLQVRSSYSPEPSAYAVPTILYWVTTTPEVSKAIVSTTLAISRFITVLLICLTVFLP